MADVAHDLSGPASFYEDPKVSDSGFGTGLADLVNALNTDFDWLREHTRYLQRAMEWDAGGRPSDRLLSGNDILEAKIWVARRPRVRLTGLTKMTRDEMRLAGYPDSMPDIDMCIDTKKVP